MFLNKIRNFIFNLTLQSNRRLFATVLILNVFSIFLIGIWFLVYFKQQRFYTNSETEIKQELINLSQYRYFTFSLEKNFKFDTAPESESGLNTKNAISNQISASRDKVIAMRDYDRIKDLHFVESIKGLIIDYENLNKENDLLIEFGNEKSGTYSKLLTTLEDFKSKYNVVENKVNISNEVNQFTFAVSLLKSSNDEALLFQLQSILNRMNSGLSDFGKDSSSYMLYRVFDALQNLKSIYHNYARKSLEIGSYPDKGLMNKIFSRYNKIEIRLNESLTTIKEEKNVWQALTFSFLMILILLIPITNLALFYYYIRRERNFKQLFEKHIDYLNKGIHFEEEYADILPDESDVINQFRQFSTKFIEAARILEKLAQGNLNITISKEEQFETFHNSFVKIRMHIDGLNQKITNEKRIQDQMNWIKSGIDKLTEVMRRQYDNPLLHANEIINMLVDYLKIPIGAIYLIGNENGTKYLELASAFAYGKEKQYYKKMLFGEGIIGASALEKKTLNVTNIPENYFSIISGFGETKPKNIIASPIMLNEEIFGVIELASLTRFTTEEISFVEEVCKTVAYSFAISKVYVDTLSQFENANLKIAELEVESESLRNDYEDINESYKNLSLKSSDNEFLVSKLNDLSIRLVLDLDGNIMDVNSNFENLFRADRKKFILGNYRDYMAEAVFDQNTDFEYLWKDVRAGIQLEKETGIIIAGKEHWLKQSFYPVKDDLGRVLKIQLIAFDITENYKIKKEIENLIKR